MISASVLASGPWMAPALLLAFIALAWLALRLVADAIARRRWPRWWRVMVAAPIAIYLACVYVVFLVEVLT